MSVFIPVVEQPRHARPKPDLRLAESYIPALVLYLKCIGYTCIAPIILLMQWRITVLCIAAFALLLYVDHLYLSNGIIPFIDTTALCLDVFGSTLLMLAISILRPCSQQCQGVLGIWTFLGSAYVIASVLVPRPIAHACAFILALLFIYADTSNGNGGGGGSMMITSQQQQGVSFTTVSFNQTLLLTNTILVVPPLSFFFRTTLYVILALVDIYLFRPLFQQENERLLFCKYAPVLLGSWPWYIIFGLFLGTAQLVKHLRLIKLPHYSQISYNSSSSGSNHSQQSSGAVIGGTNGSSQNCYQTTSNNNMGSSSSAQHYHHNDGASTLVQHNNNNNTFTIPILSSSSSTCSSSNIMMTGAHHHHHVPSSSSATSSSFGIHKNVQELDIMEAFRLAKEQRMGAKGAN
jgi:hypothetical protein